jgi:hypothetical protein
MCGTSLLLAPPSITRMLRLGEASASRAAIIQPAVPPGVDKISCLLENKGRKGKCTSSNDDVDLINVVCEFGVKTHSFEFTHSLRQACKIEMK